MEVTAHCLYGHGPLPVRSRPTACTVTSIACPVTVHCMRGHGLTPASPRFTARLVAVHRSRGLGSLATKPATHLSARTVTVCWPRSRRHGSPSPARSRSVARAVAVRRSYGRGSSPAVRHPRGRRPSPAWSRSIACAVTDHRPHGRGPSPVRSRSVARAVAVRRPCSRGRRPCGRGPSPAPSAPRVPVRRRFVSFAAAAAAAVAGRTLLRQLSASLHRERQRRESTRFSQPIIGFAEPIDDRLHNWFVGRHFENFRTWTVGRGSDIGHHSIRDIDQRCFVSPTL